MQESHWLTQTPSPFADDGMGRGARWQLISILLLIWSPTESKLGVREELSSAFAPSFAFAPLGRKFNSSAVFRYRKEQMIWG